MSEKIETPEGKLVGKLKVVVDVRSIPDGLSVDLFTKLMDRGIVFYDSDKGHRPKLYRVEGDVEEELPTIVDAAGNPIDAELIQSKWEEEEYWRKELYKCRMSPIHYYTNYAAKSAKPTQEELDSYLKSIDLTPTNDSTKLNTDEMKEKRDTFAKSIKLEDLQAMKAVRDKIKEEYDLETEALTKELSGATGISGFVEKAVRDKIVYSIMKSNVKEATKDLKHYIDDTRGNWDKKLLAVTDTDVLLRLWKSIQ